VLLHDVLQSGKVTLAGHYGSQQEAKVREDTGEKEEHHDPGTVPGLSLRV